MKPILSYEFNMDSARVELRFLDGAMLAIDTIAVEDEVAANMYERVRVGRKTPQSVGRK